MHDDNNENKEKTNIIWLPNSKMNVKLKCLFNKIIWKKIITF